LGGLEATELMLSEVLAENDNFRLDSEYFKKIYLANEQLLKSKDWAYLRNVSESIKSFGAYSLTNEIHYLEEGIPFLRGQNIKDGTVDFSDVLYINDAANDLLWKSEVKPEMLLLTMSGSVGSAAVALENWKYPVNSNQDIAKITTKSSLNPYYLCSLLNGLRGKLQMQRLPVGSVQQHTFIWQLEKLLVPLLSSDFQKQIETVFKAAHHKLERSKALYAAAESLLLDELGLADWQPSEENIAVKSFAASFGSGGRLDAEFYQPKYDELLEQLHKASVIKGWRVVSLGSLSSPLRYGTSAKLDT
jgi:hypothetical protein